MSNIYYKDVVEYLMKYIKSSSIASSYTLEQITCQIIDDLVDDIQDGFALSDEKDRANEVFDDYIDGLTQKEL